MNWYCTTQGEHTHVRVFMNGGICGILVFHNEEFDKLKTKHDNDYEFVSAQIPDEETGGKLINFINAEKETCTNCGRTLIFDKNQVVHCPEPSCVNHIKAIR